MPDASGVIAGPGRLRDFFTRATCFSLIAPFQQQLVGSCLCTSPIRPEYSIS